MKSHILIALLLAIGGCCERANEFSASEFSGADAQAIREVIAAQEAGWNSGSIEAYMQGYEQSDSVRFISGGTVTLGWQTVLERYKAGYTDRAAMGTLRFSDIEVEGIAHDRALVYGIWEVTREEDRLWGMFTLLFRKTEAGWRIVHDHTSLAK